MNRAKEKDIYYDFDGWLGKLYKNHEQNWIITAMENNPFVLQAIERACSGDLENGKYEDDSFVAWFGEFSGKFLEGLAYFYRLRNTQEVKSTAEKLISEYARIQAEDGYLGVYRKEERYCANKDNWDAWNQYHIISGLIRWYWATDDLQAWQIAERALNCIYRYFRDKGCVYFASSTTMNLAISHAFMLGYSVSNREEYLALAEKIVEESWVKIGGNWLNEILEGKEFYQSSSPRWEALHTIETLSLLYAATGKERYKEGFIRIWNSIRKTDIHNTGAFSTEEQACGTPYRNGIIETCCTVAWQALTSEYLRIEPNIVAADEFERTYFNAMLGSLLLGDANVSYNTPMDGLKGGKYDGRRIDSRIDLAFQFHQGAQDFNCCQANATRGLSEIVNWGILFYNSEIFINLYAPYTGRVILPGQNNFAFQMQTQYPSNGKIHIVIKEAPEDTQVVNFRIPCWVKKATVSLNGQSIQSQPGTYLKIERVWNAGDIIEMAYDFELCKTTGKEDFENKVSLSWGCLLLAYQCQEQEDPIFDLKSIKQIPQGDSLIRFVCMSDMGGKVLCDFFSVGRAAPMAEPPSYRSWLSIKS